MLVNDHKNTLSGIGFYKISTGKYRNIRRVDFQGRE